LSHNHNAEIRVQRLISASGRFRGSNPTVGDIMGCTQALRFATVSAVTGSIFLSSEAASSVLTGSIMISLYLAASLIGFSTGAAISALLLALTVRATKLPGASAANILFATCCLVWNLSGLTHSLALTCGAPEQGRTALMILACQYTAAAAWPFAVLSLWSNLAIVRWQRIGCRSLQALAVITCTLIVVPLWHGVLTGATSSLLFLKKSTPYNGAILLTLGIALFQGRLASRAMRLPILAMLLGAFGATTAVLILQVLPFKPVLNDVLRVVSEQITLLVVLGAFFLFARFRFADLFIRRSLRIISAALVAVALVLAHNFFSFFRFEDHLADPEAARVYFEVLIAVPLLFLFTLVDRSVGKCVNRWIFHAPDYRALLRELLEKLTQLRSDTEMFDVVEATARESLDLKAVQLVALENLFASEILSGTSLLKSILPNPIWMDAVNNGELVELDHDVPYNARNELELLVPVRSEGRVRHVIAVAPGLVRRGLVTHEVDYLRSMATQLGHRLDALCVEERLAAVQNRETVLQQQVTEAELRALRAQVNPHFLFNSLNSIANLVMTNPERAETMTLRLARVFRHVLANSARPLISLHEEISFLETYLQIEEARFGNRLQVSIVVDPTVAMEQIPSLILQPIVENSLKHGLGPKPGPGRLWIFAEADGDRVRLRIEDDGVGLENGAMILNGSPIQSNGIGLENVAQRLNALYQNQGRMTMEVRQAGGTRVTIVLPRENGATT
jgi:two-component system LytT family sensor kinase